MIRDINPEGSDRSDTADAASRGPDVTDPEAVPIRPAVSVLMLRDGADGLEVFIQHRVSTMDFAAGVVVFPGGRVDPIDERTAPTIAVADPTVHTSAWADSTIAEAAEGWRVLLATAVREVEEETGAVLDPAGLVPWANWVTPLGRPKRFDTYFYVIAAPELAAAHHQTTEAHTSEWRSINGILADEAAGTLKLMRPTFVLLRDLSSFSSVAGVLGAERTIDPVRPDFPSTRGS
ncbi:NUDIX hydrolase [Brevibacterium spongiae]|uniref:NUDIX domain-containing protein n=1 Tax=Brevibacterium spongiae TaxID=2909672 RepID=A0ABY5SRY3_9MICO|nr:NUDIX domain-containing protein [Brevibacterium spongiae]UVI35829.1 NUDIX domain-containing protein [Brevibacterium spongiae]